MKKLLIIFALVCCVACTDKPPVESSYKGFVIGFRGDQDRFDLDAFKEFAQHRKLMPIALSPTQDALARELIANSEGYYELYGFSQGAKTVGRILRRTKQDRVRMPGRITTIGAYYTVDVDFTVYDVPFVNYFDDSGRQTKSPGIQIYNVDHLGLQQAVNKKLNQSKGNSCS